MEGVFVVWSISLVCLVLKSECEHVLLGETLMVWCIGYIQNDGRSPWSIVCFREKKKIKFFVWKDKFWVYYFYSNCSCVWHVFLSSCVHHYGEMGRKLKGAGVKLRELWCNFLLRLSEKAFNSVSENKGRAANAFFPLNFCCCSDCQKIICLSCSCNFE